jgi:hypothetical protein
MLKKLPENLGPRSDACHVIHRQIVTDTDSS